jgi:hypothetical protein
MRIIYDRLNQLKRNFYLTDLNTNIENEIKIEKRITLCGVEKHINQSKFPFKEYSISMVIYVEEKYV